MNLWIQHEMALETLRSAIPGGPRGWHPVRLIFRDFWHWRDYELGFAHGRLALTGQNRGGKSSILGLVIPALLDGDTSPSRLDPSQSRDRHIHWYLLGHEHLDPDQPGVFAKRARTGYIALEFRHGETGRYLTIGMGFSAARHVQRRIRDWCGFVLPDLRLGRDLDVRGADGNCLEPREFIRRLGPPAVATGDRAEYRRQVNRHLFGMTDDDYAALISMLLQARRPKLGEQAGPDQVCLLLRDALPGIPPERLDQVAEVVHNIEEYQRNLEDVARRAACVEELDRLLLELAEVLVQKAAAEFASAQGRHGSLAARLQQAREQLQRAEGERQAAAAQLAAVEARLGEVRARLAVLRDHDAAELPLKLQAEEQEVRDLERRLDFLREQLEAERRILDQHHRALRELAERFGARVRRIGQRLTALGHRARSSGWEAGARELMDAAAALDPLRVDAAPADLEAARPDPAIAPEGQDLVRQYRELARLRAGVEAAEAEYRQRQDRADSLRAQQEELTERVRQAEEEADARREALVAALRAWQERSPALEVPDPVLAGVIRAVQALAAAPERGYEALVEGIRNLAAQRQRHLEAALAEAALEQARAEVQMAALAERLAELGRTGLVPDRSELRRRARSAAPEDPSWRPLFRWVRFRPGVPPEVAARVEAAALEAGLLDLLLAPPAEDAADPAPDAWAVPAPLTGVPTLLEVMEPEPGAPERVAQVLASVGWGEGPGDRWIAPDGRWRHGIACGQVAPWLTEPTGLVGEERRQAALQARLAALRQARDAWQAERDAAIRRQEELRQQMAALGEELRALADLPWQALFDALTRVDQLRGQAEEARRQVEAARGEAEA
ncbi:MAG: hypothetical protein DIU70_012095, partial [Bacillota bacterium]